MRPPWPLIIVPLLITLAGCATRPTAPPVVGRPKIEGRVTSVAHKDIRIVTALAQRQMRHDIGWAVPIERIMVFDRDHISVDYSHGGYTHSLPMRRVNGAWEPPPMHVVVDG